METLTQAELASRFYLLSLPAEAAARPPAGFPATTTLIRSRQAEAVDPSALRQLEAILPTATLASVPSEHAALFEPEELSHVIAAHLASHADKSL